MFRSISDTVTLIQQAKDSGNSDFIEKALLLIVGAILGGLLVPWLKHVLVTFWTAIQNKFSRKRKFQRDYLNWAIQSNKFISVLPSTMAGVKTGTLHLMELDGIYISLSVSRGVEIGKAFSLPEAMAKSNRLIILGDPGSGKSTMMQYLTFQTASALAGKTKKRSEFSKHFPILIRLNKFHDIANWPASKDLLAAIKGEIEANLAKVIPQDFLEKKLERGKCLILLDAFDELASGQARQLLAEKVKNFVALYPDNQFIVTSRITGYNNQLAAAGFEAPFTIQKLAPDHIRSFVYKWYQHIAGLQSHDQDENAKAYLRKEYAQRGQALLEVIFKNERISQLAINPMLLSLITLVHYVKVRLPDQRHLLYRECIDILVEQWDAARGIHAPMLQDLSVEEKKHILQRLAWYMHEHHLKSIAKTDLIDGILRETCREIGGEKIKDGDLENFLKAIEERTGLLVEKGFNDQGQPELNFSHLTFQEYFTALELFSLHKDEDGVFHLIWQKIATDSEWWQEVGLLTLSQFKNPLAYQKKLHEKIFHGDEQPL